MKWLKNLYMKGKQPQEAELIEEMEKAEEAGEGKQLARTINNDKDIVENNLNINNKELDIESEEMEELLEWTENLNFDAYVKDWYQLSTS